METTPSSAWRWTRPCPVRLVRWGNNEGRWYQIKGGDLPYVRDNDNSCSIMALWYNSTTSLLLVFTPFGYWFLYFHLSLYYFIISKFLAPSFFYSLLYPPTYFMHLVLPIFLLILLLSFLLFPFCHTGPVPFVPAVLTPSLCVCLCVLPCMVRSPWAVNSSPAHYLQTPTRMRAAATCWSSWTIRCPLLHSHVPPTPQHQCLDQCLITWMVRVHVEEHIGVNNL